MCLRWIRCHVVTCPPSSSKTGCKLRVWSSNGHLTCKSISPECTHCSKPTRPVRGTELEQLLHQLRGAFETWAVSLPPNTDNSGSIVKQRDHIRRVQRARAQADGWAGPAVAQRSAVTATFRPAQSPGSCCPAPQPLIGVQTHEASQIGSRLGSDACAGSAVSAFGPLSYTRCSPTSIGLVPAAFRAAAGFRVTPPTACVACCRRRPSRQDTPGTC